MEAPRANLRRLVLLALVPLAVLVLALAGGRGGLRGEGGIVAARVLPSAAVSAEERALHAAAAHGALPGWDPDRGAGVPLLATLARGAWSPLRAPRWLAEPEPAAAWSAFVVLFVLGLGVERVLARVTPSAAAVVALALQLAALASGELADGARVEALAFLPWAAWAALELERAPTRARLVLAGSAAAAVLANAPIEAAIVGAAGALVVLARVATRAARPGARVHARVALGLGLALGAPELAPRLAHRARVESALTWPAPASSARAARPALAELDRATLDAVRATAGDGRVVRVADDAEDARELAPTGALAAAGIGELDAAGAALEPRVAELLDRLDPALRAGGAPLRLPRASLVNHALFDRLRVTCVLAREPLENPRLALVRAEGGRFVYRRDGALPYARVVPGELVQVPGAIGALGLLQAGALDATSAAIADANDALPRAPSTAPFHAGELLVRRPEADRVDVEVRGSSGGWLVFQEAWDPGWKAAIDGEDVDFVRLDHAFRALPLRAGDSIVRTKYEPFELRLGAWIAVGAALATALFAFGARRAHASGG
ncbi:MAG: hypothetical protein U1F29_11380 [Planctomycetota bacterium]